MRTRSRGEWGQRNAQRCRNEWRADTDTAQASAAHTCETGGIGTRHATCEESRARISDKTMTRTRRGEVERERQVHFELVAHVHRRCRGTRRRDQNEGNVSTASDCGDVGRMKDGNASASEACCWQHARLNEATRSDPQERKEVRQREQADHNEQQREQGAGSMKQNQRRTFAGGEVARRGHEPKRRLDLEARIEHRLRKRCTNNNGHESSDRVAQQEGARLAN